MKQIKYNSANVAAKALPDAAVMRLFHRLEHSKALGLLVSGALLLLIGLIDFLTGYEVGFALFYLFPIMISTWVAGRWAGIATAVVSAAIWLFTDFAAGHSYREPLSPFWNATMRMGIFVIVAQLVEALRNLVELERTLSRTDHLTGVANRRAFTETLEWESIRSARFRHPFSLVYVDVDDFKKLNDVYGHRTGDAALCTIAKTFSENLRSMDLVGRMGGDELAVLLPECDRDTARKVVGRSAEACAKRIGERGWPISLSVGVMTFNRGDITVDEMLTHVDELMYRGKRSGKNSVQYGEFEAPEADWVPGQRHSV